MLSTKMMILLNNNTYLLNIDLRKELSKLFHANDLRINFLGVCTFYLRTKHLLLKNKQTLICSFLRTFIFQFCTKAAVIRNQSCYKDKFNSPINRATMVNYLAARNGPILQSKRADPVAPAPSDNYQEYLIIGHYLLSWFYNTFMLTPLFEMRLAAVCLR